MVYSRKVCIEEKRCTPGNLKQGLCCSSAHHPSVDVDDIAAKLQVPAHKLRAWMNESQPDQIPAWVLFKLVFVLGVSYRWLLDLALADANLAGLLTVAPVASTNVSTGQVMAEYLDTVAAKGRTADVVRGALQGGGVIEPREVPEIRAALHREQTEIAEFDQSLAKLETQEHGATAWPRRMAR
jgi:hypothetical protein